MRWGVWTEHQTTNLGVRSSNLFGRANYIRNLGWFCPLILRSFSALGYTIRYTTVLACARKSAGTLRAAQIRSV